MAWVAAAALTIGGVTVAQQWQGSENAEAVVPPRHTSSEYTLSDAQEWNDRTLYQVNRDVRATTTIGGHPAQERVGSSYNLDGANQVSDQRLNWLWGPNGTNGQYVSGINSARFGGLAIDSGRYVGRAGYKGDGATAYFWSWRRGAEGDYAPTDAQHPSTNINLANGANSPTMWTAVFATRTGSTTGEVFWVPNPITAENWPSNAPYFPNKPQKPSNARWGEITSGENSWSGGEVLQSTGEIYFTSRFNADIWKDFRILIVDPSTGDFAASGFLQPATPSDNIFHEPDSNPLISGQGASNSGATTGDVALDGYGNVYIVVEGNPRSGNLWYDGSGRRGYLVRVVPTRDPVTNAVVHNGMWKYNIVTALHADPSAVSASGNDLTERWGGANGAGSSDLNNKVIGMAFLNGTLYACDRTRLFAIDPLTGYVKVAGTPTSSYRLENGFTGMDCEDMASGQMAMVISGQIFNDLNASGSRDGTEPGVPDLDVGLYVTAGNNQWKLASVRQTDGSGNYAFLVGGQGTYQVRVIRPTIDSVNAMQTYAGGGIGRNPDYGDNTATTHCWSYQSNSVVESTAVDNVCAGALPSPYSDTPVAAGNGSIGEIKPLSEMAIYTTVEVLDASNIPYIDFGITASGSFGDAEPGPATVTANAPAHVNGLNPNTVFLGSSLGTYTGPATDGSAHNATDDGVFVQVPGGAISLNPINNEKQTFVSRGSYPLVAQLSGQAATDPAARVKGWTTSAGPSRAWVPAASWTPTLSGGVAVGPWTPSSNAPSSSTGLAANLRVDASLVNPSRPDNGLSEYQASTTSGTASWTSVGEIEDYSYLVADAVYRVGVQSQGSVGTFRVEDRDFTTTSPNTPVFAAGRAVAAGAARNVDVRVPNADWTVKSVEITNTFTGATVSTPQCAASGQNVCTFSFTPALGDDLTVLVTTATYATSSDFQLAVDKTSAGVGEVITATVSPSPGSSARPGQEIRFTPSDPKLVIRNANNDPVTSCILDASGTCQVFVNGSEPGSYTLSAKVETGANTWDNIVNSPVSLTIDPGRAVPEKSELVVTPAGPLPVGVGTDSTYTATVTARDANGFIVPDTEVTFGVNPTGTNNVADLGQGRLSNATCRTGSDGTCFVTLTSTKSGTFDIHARIPGQGGALEDVLGNGDPTKRSPAIRTYSAGTNVCDPALSPTTCHSSLVISPDRVDVGGTATATVTLEDDYGNPIERVTQGQMAFTAAPGGLELVADYTEVSPGVYTITVTSNLPNIYTLTARPTGVALSDDVTFGSGEARPRSSVFEVTPAGPLQVGTEDANKYTLKLTAYDGIGTANGGKGNLVAGTWVTFSITAGDAGLGGLSSATCQTNQSGYCTVTATSTKTGKLTFQAEIPDPDNNNTLTRVGDLEEREYVAGPIDATRSSLVVSPDPVAAGENATATVTLKDRYDNLIPGKAAQINGTVTPDGTIGTFVETTPGVYTAPVSNLQRAVEHEATVVPAAGIELKDTFTVSAGPPDANHSTFVIDPDQLPVTTHTTATFTIKDRFDNPISGLSPTISAGSLTSSRISAGWGANGEYKWDLTTGTGGTYTVTADLANPVAITKQADVEFMVGDVCYVMIKSVDPTSAVVSYAAQGTVVVTFEVLDCNHNPVPHLLLADFDLTDRFHALPGGPNFPLNSPDNVLIRTGSFHENPASQDYSLTIASTIAGSYDVFVNYVGGTPNVVSDPAFVIFTADSPPTPDLVTWTITPEPPAAVVIPGTALGTLVAQDQFGNGIDMTQAQIQIVSSPGGISILGEIVKERDIYGNPTGTYLVSLKTEVPGTYDVTVTVPGRDAQGNTMDISKTDDVIFRSPDAGNVTLVYDPSTHVVSQDAGAGVHAKITVKAADGTPVTNLGEGAFTFATSLDGSPTTNVRIKQGSFANLGQGDYSFLVYSTKVGTYTSQVTVGTSTSSPASVTFTHGPASSATWVIDPTQVTIPLGAASGSATGIYTLYDEYDNVISDQASSVTVTSDPSSLTIGTARVVDGAYHYTLTSAVDGTFTVTADRAVIGPKTATVTFTRSVSPIDPNSSVAVRPTDGSEPVYVDETWTVTVRPVDGAGAPVTGLTNVTVTVPDGDASMRISPVTETSPGVYEATVTTTKSGVFTINASAGGVPLNQRPTIKFYGGPDIDPTKSNLSAAPLTQIAGVPVQVTMLARDKYDNPVTDMTAADFQVIGEAVAPTAAPTVSYIPGTFVSQGDNGVYTVNITSTKVGDFRLTGTARGTDFLQHPVVTFVAGSPSKSWAELTKTNALADGRDTVEVTVHAVDGYDNPVPNAEVVGTRFNNTALTPNPNILRTGQDGIAVLKWTSTTAGTYTATITVDGLTQFPGSTQNQLAFTIVGAHPEYSTLEVYPTASSDVAPIAAGHAYTAKVTLRNNLGQIVPGAVASFDISTVDGYKPVINPVTCTARSDGTCEVQVTSTKATTFDLTAKIPFNGGMEHITGSPWPVTWKAAEVCVPTEVEGCLTRVVVTKDNQLANGNATDEATLYAYDRYGNPVPNVAWQSSTTDSGLTVVNPVGATSTQPGDLGQAVISYTSRIQGSHPASVSVAGKPLPGIVLSFTNVPWGRATLTVTPTGAQPVDSRFTLMAFIQGADGTPINGAAVSLVTSSPDLKFVGDTSTCTTNNQGTCSVQVTATKSGSYEVGFPAGVAPEIVGSPATVVFDPGPLDATESTVEILVNGSQPDGQEQDIVRVVARDKYKNVIRDAVADSSSRDARMQVVRPIALTDTDGTTQIAYTSLVQGAYVADVTLSKNGVTVTPTGSPVTLEFTPVHIVSGTLDITPKTALEVGRAAANTFTATVTAYGEDGRAAVGGVATFSIDPNDAPEWVNGQQSCVTNTQGQCSVQLYSTKAGGYTVSVAGYQGRILDSAPVMWNPGPVCGVECDPEPDDPELWTHAVVTSNNAIANDIDPDIVTIWAFDQYGNPVPEQPAMSTSPDPSVRVEASPAPTGNGTGGTIKGVTTISYYGSQPGTFSLTDITVGNKVPHNLPLSIAFVNDCIPELDPECDATDKWSYLEVTRDSQSANGQDTDQVTVHLLDRLGNAVANQQVRSSAASGSPVSVVTPIAPTNAQGQSVISYTSNKSGQYEVSVSINRPSGWVELKLPDPASLPPGVTIPASHKESPVALTFVACFPGLDPGCVPEDGAERSRVVVDPDNQRADGNGRDVANVYLFDATGMSVTDARVWSTSTASDLTIQPEGTISHTSAGGATTIWYSTARSGGGDFQARVLFEVGGRQGELVYIPDQTVPAQPTYQSSPFTMHFVDLLPAPIILTPVENALLTDNTPDITGTGEPGARLEVEVDGAVVGTTTVTPAGTWSVTPTQPLGEGPHTITATQSDDVGTSPEAVRHVTVDTVKPEPPVITSPAPNESVNAENGLPVIGTAEPNTDITVRGDPPAGGGEGPVLCTAHVDAQGNWNCLVPADRVPGEGDHVLSATATDAAGNVSDPAVVPYKIDNTAPTFTFDVPTEGEVVPDTTPTFAGTGEPGAKVTVKEGPTVLCEATVAANGQWSCDSTRELPVGPHTVVGQAEDAAGNDSPVVTRTFVVDTSRPQPPTIIHPAEGSYVNTPVTSFDGTGVPGSTLQVREGGQILCTTQVTPAGTWQCSAPLPEGEHTVTAIQTAPNSLVSEPTAPRHFTVDWTVKTCLEDPNAEYCFDITKPVEGALINDNTPTFEGTGEPGGTVTVKDEDGQVLCQAVVGDTGANRGLWTCTSDEVLPEGENTVYGELTDLAGNTTEPPVERTFTVDTEAPCVVNDPRPECSDYPYPFDIIEPAEGSTIPDSTPTFVGTGEPAGTVEIKEGDRLLCTTTVAANGTWSCESTTVLPDGVHTVKGTETDRAGNESDEVSRTFTVKTTTPPLCLELPGHPQTGCFDITKPEEGAFIQEHAPHFEGVGETGTVTITAPDGRTMCENVQVAANGSWSCDSSLTLPDGRYTVKGVFTDLAGNRSNDLPRTFTIDSQICTPQDPNCFTVTKPGEGEWVDTDKPTFEGTGEPGGTVTVEEGDTTLCTATVNAAGTWSCDSTVSLPDGEHTVEATLVDQAGNVSDPIERTFGVDTEDPTMAITRPAEGAKLNANAVTISGTGEPAGTVTIREQGTVLCTVVVNAAGTWTCPTVTLPDGAHTIVGVEVDKAGNTSAPVTRAFDIRTTGPTLCRDIPPGQPVVDCFDIVKPGENEVINDNRPNFEGTGEPGDKVVVTDKGTGDVLCETVVAPNKTWACESTKALPEGPVTVVGTVTDEFNNSAEVERHFEIDLTGPEIAITKPGEGEKINDNTPVFEGTGEPGVPVVVTDKDTGEELCRTTVGPDGHWSCTSTKPLPDGDHTIVAEATDPAGNVTQDEREFTVDTVPPCVNPNNPQCFDIKVPAENSSVPDTTPTFSGTGEPRGTVTITENGQTLCESTVGGDGTWSCTSNVALTPTWHTVRGVETDEAGNVSDPVNRRFRVDTGIEGVFDITKPAEGEHVPSRTPDFEGHGEPGATVTVTVKDTGEVLCETGVSQSGLWSCTSAVPLPEGEVTVTGTIEDEAGNTQSEDRTFVVDTVPPWFEIDHPSEGSKINDNKPTFDGTGEPGSVVKIVEGGDLLCEATVAANGTWSCESTVALGEGPHTVTGTVTDEAGNESDPIVRHFEVDTVIEPPVVTKPGEGESINTEQGFEVTGTAEPDSEVTVKDKDTGETLCTAHTDAVGHWACEVPADKAPGDGEHTLVVTAEDEAGNVSDPTERPYVVDNTPPAVRITSPADGDSVQGSTSHPLVVTGTGETAGDKIVVDDGHGNTCTTQVLANLTWTCTFTDQIPEGRTTITATATDRAGNTGTDHREIVVDRTPPAPPKVDHPIDGGYVDTNKPDISGTGDPGDTIKVVDEDGNTLCEDVPVLANGTWSCVPKVPLPDGDHTLIVTEEDPAGNVSDETKVTVTVDTVAPDKPIITSPAEGSFINDSTPTITGTAEPGSTVHVSAGPNNQCTTTADAQGNWSCDLPLALPDGPATVTAVAVDKAGNRSEPAEVHFTVDTVPPPLTVDTRDPEEIKGTTDPDVAIDIKDDEGRTICQTTSDAQGNWSCRPTKPLKPGDEITVTATDKAGNSTSVKVRLILVKFDKPSIAQGDQQVARGFYFQPGERVHGYWDVTGQTKDLGWQVANGSGEVVFTWTVPADADKKTYQVDLIGEKSGPGSASFQVTAPIVKTGSPVGTEFMIGASLMALLGGVFILVAWRRRKDEEEKTSKAVA